LSGSKNSVSPYDIRTYETLGSGGFEPSKAEPTDLQPLPELADITAPIIYTGIILKKKYSVNKENTL
jgi:hypothetical protein